MFTYNLINRNILIVVLISFLSLVMYPEQLEL